MRITDGMRDGETLATRDARTGHGAHILYCRDTY